MARTFTIVMIILGMFMLFMFAGIQDTSTSRTLTCFMGPNYDIKNLSNQNNTPSTTTSCIFKNFIDPSSPIKTATNIGTSAIFAGAVVLGYLPIQYIVFGPLITILGTWVISDTISMISTMTTFFADSEFKFMGYVILFFGILFIAAFIMSLFELWQGTD